jgi:hypothetical protein
MHSINSILFTSIKYRYKVWLRSVSIVNVSSGSIQIALTNEDNLFYGIIFGVIGKLY